MTTTRTTRFNPGDYVTLESDRTVFGVVSSVSTEKGRVTMFPGATVYTYRVQWFASDSSRLALSRTYEAWELRAADFPLANTAPPQTATQAQVFARPPQVRVDMAMDHDRTVYQVIVRDSQGNEREVRYFDSYADARDSAERMHRLWETPSSIIDAGAAQQLADREAAQAILQQPMPPASLPNTVREMLEADNREQREQQEAHTSLENLVRDGVIQLDARGEEVEPVRYRYEVNDIVLHRGFGNSIADIGRRTLCEVIRRFEEDHSPRYELRDQNGDTFTATEDRIMRAPPTNAFGDPMTNLFYGEEAGISASVFDELKRNEGKVTLPMEDARGRRYFMKIEVTNWDNRPAPEAASDEKPRVFGGKRRITGLDE